jgi:hypothetical protein
MYEKNKKSVEALLNKMKIPDQVHFREALKNHLREIKQGNG